MADAKTDLFTNLPITRHLFALCHLLKSFVLVARP